MTEEEEEERRLAARAERDRILLEEAQRRVRRATVADSATFSFPSVTTSTFTGNTYLLRVSRDEGQWIVSEDGSALYGTGRTLLEAMTDLWHAALALPEVTGERMGARLAYQVEIAKRLTEALDG